MVNIEPIVKIALIVVACIFVLVLIAKRFLYFKPSSDFEYPQANFEDIYEGEIHAWFLKGNNNKLILFCHGNAGNISHRQEKVINLNNLGYSVLIFDYTGFGNSKGVPTESKCYHNGCMFADIFINKYGKNNIIPYGESMGGAVASHIALRYNMPYLILESALPSIKSYISSHYKLLGIISFLFNDFNTNDYVKKYTGKILVLHCRNDEIVYWDTTETLRNRATKVIEMNGGHNDAQIPWNEIDRFLNN